MGKYPKNGQGKLALSAILLGLLDRSAAILTRIGFYSSSFGSAGRAFLADISQAQWQWLGSAFIGGAVFNIANILLVAAIEIAGLAVAFPVGIGLALVLGVVTTYLATPEGNVPMLAAGVALVCVAIVLDAVAYGKLGGRKSDVKKGEIHGGGRRLWRAGIR